MNKPASATQPATSPARSKALLGLSAGAIGFLLLTLAVSLAYSHAKLLWEDEILELWTDRLPTLGQVIHIEAHATIALEPIVNHIFEHFSVALLGQSAFAARLPSLLGFLLMQVCLYVFVRRLAGERAGLFALAFPALSHALHYSAEARPYAMLLGWCALSMVCWQTAARRSTNRIFPLCALAVATALALNTHFYAVLFLVPLCGAELYRTAERRRLDLPMVGAIAAGIASLVFTIPFVKAAAVYRTHFFDDNGSRFRMISQCYRTLLIDYTTYSLRTQHYLALLFLAVAFVFAIACVMQLRKQDLHASGSEPAFLILMAAIPLFGGLLAHFVTHALQNRYTLGGIIGVSGLLAITLAPWLRRPRAGAAILGGLAIAIIGWNAVQMHALSLQKKSYLASTVIDPQLKAAIAASPSHLLYFTYLANFTTASYYEPDPEVRSHLALIGSTAEELRWNQMDTMSLMTAHAATFTGLHIFEYETLKQEPGEHVMLLNYSTQEWVEKAWAEKHIVPRTIGHAFNGDAVVVTFPPTP